MTQPSLVSKNTTELDMGALVSLTNKAQAVALILANDSIVPEAARDFYNQANECFKKAMRAAHEASKARG